MTRALLGPQAFRPTSVTTVRPMRVGGMTLIARAVLPRRRGLRSPTPLMEYGATPSSLRAWRGANRNVLFFVGVSSLGAHSRSGHHPDSARDRSPSSGPARGRRREARPEQ